MEVGVSIAYPRDGNDMVVDGLRERVLVRGIAKLVAQLNSKMKAKERTKLKIKSTLKTNLELRDSFGRHGILRHEDGKLPRGTIIDERVRKH
jgi:signal transduction protein with GAF and PtsI domain